VNDLQGDLFSARARRDLGLERASSHAEAETPGWNERALELLLAFVALRNGRPFLTEDFVEFTAGKIEPPPDPRTWGAPIQRAARARRIRRIGYAPARSSNCAPKCVWQAT